MYVSTGSARYSAAVVHKLDRYTLNLSGDTLYFITFEDVFFLNVIVILKHDTTFIGFFDFLDFVFEAFQRLQGAFMNDHIIA